MLPGWRPETAMAIGPGFAVVQPQNAPAGVPHRKRKRRSLDPEDIAYVLVRVSAFLRDRIGKRVPESRTERASDVLFVHEVKPFRRPYGLF